jgi:branched-chain amino acid aminotransferase
MTETINIEVKRTEVSKLLKVDFKNIPFGKIYSDHMFMADFINGEWTDFKIAPYENLSLSPANSALHYGQSIFEGMKANRSENGDILIFRPLENLKRLNISADRMCIPAVPEEVFMGGLTQLLKLDKSWIPDIPGTSLYIRPIIFATDEYIGIRPSDNYKFLIFTCPVGAYYAEPVRVKIETQYVRAAPGGTGFAKAAGNYAAALYPARFAQKLGYHQLLWTDAISHEFIEESGTMNVMFLIDDVLVTAPSGGTILQGITRNSVLTLAKDWGYKIEERKVSVKEIIDAIKKETLQEAFGTGTAATIAHIAEIGHEEENYILPEVKNRVLSHRLMTELDKIKSGKIADRFGWIYKL